MCVQTAAHLEARVPRSVVCLCTGRGVAHVFVLGSHGGSECAAVGWMPVSPCLCVQTAAISSGLCHLCAPTCVFLMQGIALWWS